MASKVDPNVYALSIQLSLEAGDAFKTLDSFGEKVTDIEQQLTSSAKTALQSIQEITTTATQAVTDLAAAFKGVDSNTTKVQTTLVDTSKELTEQFDNGEDRLENAIDIFKQLEKTFDMHEDTGKELKTHILANERFLKGLLAITKAIKLKNAGHLEQNQLLKTDNDLIQKMNGSLEGTVSGGERANVAFRKMLASATALWRLIQQIDADTEKFTATNYRAYGSQQQLVQSSRNLAMEHGVFYENAVEAYKVLGNLRTPREEMDKYAASIGKANRYTGVSIQTLGVFTQRIRGAGGDSVQTERALVHMSEAMRKFGLSSEDTSKILGDTAVSGKELQIIFGGSKTAVEGFDSIKASLMGVNKEMGMSTDVANNYMNTLAKDPIMRAKLTSLTGVQIKNEQDLAQAIAKSGNALRARGVDIKQLEAEAAAGSISAQMRLKNLANVYAAGDVNALLMLVRVGELTDEMGEQVKTTADLEKALSKAKDSGLDPFSEANNTLTAQLTMLKSALWSALGTILQLAADAIMPFVQALNWLIKQIAALIGWIRQKIQWLEKTIPGFKYVTGAVKFLAGLLIALGIAFLFVAGGITSFATVFSGASRVVSGASRIILSMGQMLVQMATYVGQAIIIILRSIGQGLQALGNAVKSVIGPLLGLALALLLVAIAAYIFALAVKVIAEVGWAAIPAMIGLIIAVAILGLVLIGLAMLVQGPIAVGLIILAFAFLAVGIAAYLTGLGLLMAAIAIQMLSDSLSFKLILKIGLLGVVLLALGAIGLMALPGIMLLAFGMLLLALAVWVLGGAFENIVKSLATISGEQGERMQEVGISFLIAGICFLVAAITMAMAAMIFMFAAPTLLFAAYLVGIAAALIVPAAISLMVAGIMLLIGSLAILAAAVILTVATMLLFVDAAMLMIAASGIILAGTMLILGGVLLITAGVILAIAAIILIIGGFFLIEASIMLMVAGGMLIGAGIMLMIGLFFLEDSSAQMFDIGMRIGVGGIMMYLGALHIMMAASLLGDSAGYIEKSMDILEGLAPKMLGAVGSLGFSAWLMKRAAWDLGDAGDWLIPASFSIYIGMRWLEWAIDRFARTVDQVDKIAKAILSLALSFQVLRTIPTNTLRELASQSLAAMPDVEALGDRIMAAAQKLDAGVTQFEAPANRLIEILDRLSKSVKEFSAGIKVGDDVAKLAEKLDKYATLLENTSTRIETAVKSKAVPAMRAAEEAGIEEAIRSEAISTVQVMYDETGEAGENQDQMMEIYNKQTSLLESLDNRLAAMQTGKNDVGEILTLLQAHLPGMTKGDAGLGSELNSWAK